MGLASGSITAVLTCPLDVVNTRLKAMQTSKANASLGGAFSEIVAKEGTGALFRGLVPRVIILGLGSSIFWPVYKRLN